MSSLAKVLLIQTPCGELANALFKDIWPGYLLPSVRLMVVPLCSLSVGTCLIKGSGIFN